MSKRPDIKALLEQDLAPGDGVASPLRTILGRGTPGRFMQVKVETLAPNPDQPRKTFDPSALEDLTASIKEQGILEPVLIHENADGSGYTLIAGERRWRAAKAAGLSYLPAVVFPKERALEIAIIENLQREDLTALEEAEGLFRLKQERAYTDAELAKIIGKSRTSITESLALNNLPDAIKEQCRTSDIWTKSQLLEVLRAGNEEKITDTFEALRTGAVRTVRELRRETRRASSSNKTKPYMHTFRPEDGRFRLTVTFRKSRVSRDELKAALREAINDID